MTARRASRVLLYAPLALGAAAFVAYVLVWRSGAQIMKSEVSKWAAHQSGAGAAADFDPLEMKGFPFFLRGELKHVSFSIYGRRWRTQRLFIDASPFDPNRFIVSLPAPQTIELRSGGSLRIDAPGARFSVTRDKTRRWIVDVETGPLRLSAPALTLSAAQVLLTIAPDGSAQSLEGSLSAQGVAVAVNGAAVPTADVGAVFELSRMALLARPKAWREAGGAIKLRRIELQIPDASAAFSGRLGLDAALRIEGRIDAQIVNPAPLARFLGALGALDPKDVEAAAASLSLAAIAQGGMISAPIGFKDGAATVLGLTPGRAEPAQP